MLPGACQLRRFVLSLRVSLRNVVADGDFQSYEGAYAQRPGLEANGETLWSFSRVLEFSTTVCSSNYLAPPITAGPTYCAVASYSLASRLHTLPEPDHLLRWLVHRQVEPSEPTPSEGGSEIDSDHPGGGTSAEVGPTVRDPDVGPERRERPAVKVAGFQGRANKPTDACYSFWNTAALEVRLHLSARSPALEVSDQGTASPPPPPPLRCQILIPAISPKLALLDLVDPELDRAWLLSCQHPVFGGIARERQAPPGTSLCPQSLLRAGSIAILRAAC